MGTLSTKNDSKDRRVQLGRVDDDAPNNCVYTAKYSLISFVPKCLLLQFLRLSNIVFLANAILQSIPILSAISPLTAIGPLCFVLLVSMIR